MRTRWLALIGVAGCLFFAYAGDADATEPIEIEGPAAAAEIEEGHELESTTYPVFSTFSCHSTGEAEWAVEIVVEGARQSYMGHTKGGKTETQWASTSVLVGPKKKYHWHKASGAATVTCELTSAKLHTNAVAGPEGKEGKEGKEGPAGKEGPPGPEGKAGSGAGGGETEVASFGPTAQATLAEGVEVIELVGFCIIGCMLAGSVFVMVRKLLGTS